MKNKILMACLASGLVTLGRPAHAAAKPAFASSHIASFAHKHNARSAGRPAPLAERDVSGVIPSAIRGGNPLQMLNPRAPARYGTAEENVVLDPDIPGRGDGIKLLSISF